VYFPLIFKQSNSNEQNIPYHYVPSLLSFSLLSFFSRVFTFTFVFRFLCFFCCKSMKKKDIKNFIFLIFLQFVVFLFISIFYLLFLSTFFSVFLCKQKIQNQKKIYRSAKKSKSVFIFVFFLSCCFVCFGNGNEFLATVDHFLRETRKKKAY